MGNDTTVPEPLPAPHQREHKLAILAGFMFAGVALGAAYYALFASRDLDIPDRELSDTEITDLLRLTRLPFLTEPAAEEIVTQFGYGALPFLSATLRTSDTPPRVQGNICFILGKYREGEYTPEIIRSLEKNLVANMTSAHLAAIVSTMNGLGYSGDAEALGFLEKLAGETYWDRLPVTLSRAGDSDDESSAHSGERLRRLFRDRSLRSLGLAPNGAGAGALKRLAGTLPEELEEVRAAALSESRRRKWRLNELSGV